MQDRLQVDISYRQILRIALPISLALLVPNFNFIINNIFLGQYSKEALATASITGVYYLVFNGIGYGLNNGLQALMARRAGENDPAAIGKLFQQGIFVSLSMALIGIAVTYLLAPYILAWTIRDPHVRDTALSFLKIRIWGLPFLYIYQMRNALLVSINKSRFLVLGTVAEAIVNVVFDYGLIFGALSMPALGFNGAAYASILAEFTGMFVIYLVLHRRGLAQQFNLFKWADPDTKLIRSILSMSGPLIFQHAISIISWLFFYILLERNSGQNGLAVSNTMRNIFGFFGVFVWAFAATTNTMVSNIIGQGKSGQVPILLKRLVVCSLSLALIVCVILNIFPHAYLSIYGQDAAFIQAGIPVLRVVAFALVLMSVSTIWLNAVTGTGKSRVTFLIEVAAIACYCIYVFTVLEGYRLGLVWAWLSEFLYWSVLFGLSWWYMRSGKWKAARI